MAAPSELLDLFRDALTALDLDLAAWSAACARVLPTVFLVPAFGLRALATPTRVALGLALAAGIAPALVPISSHNTPWVIMFATELVKGLPVALTAASALWIATMVGGLVDNLRGSREHFDLPTVEPGSTPIGILLAMLAAIAFLQTGGPAHVARALMQPGLEVRGPLEHAARTLAGGVELAVAAAAPLVAVSIAAELMHALIARAASPAYVQAIVAPFKSFLILGALALLLDRIVELLALWSQRV